MEKYKQIIVVWLVGSKDRDNIDSGSLFDGKER